MAVDEVIERSTIVFPKAIPVSEIETLLQSIARKIPANINYQINQNKNIYQENHQENLAIQDKRDTIEISYGTFTLSGMITIQRPGFCVPDTFSIQDEEGKITKLEFFHIPEYDIGDYRKEQIQLWDEVRKSIMDYFNEPTH